MNLKETYPYAFERTIIELLCNHYDTFLAINVPFIAIQHNYYNILLMCIYVIIHTLRFNYITFHIFYIKLIKKIMLQLAELIALICEHFIEKYFET